MRLKLALSLLTAAGAIIASAMIVFLLLNLGPVQRFFLRSLEPVIPWTVEWDSLKFEALGGEVRLNGFKARSHDGHLNVTVDEVTTRIRLGSLLRGALVLEPLVATEATIHQIPYPEAPRRDLKAVGRRFQEGIGSLLLRRLEIREGRVGPLAFDLEGRYAYTLDEARVSLDTSLFGASRSDLNVSRFQLKLPGGESFEADGISFHGRLDPGPFFSAADEIYLQGTLNCTGGRLREKTLGDVGLEAELSHDRVVLKKLETRHGDGMVTISGTLRGLTRPESSFEASASYENRAELVFPLTAEASGRVGEGKIFLDKIAAAMGPATLDARGSISLPKQEVDLTLVVDALDTRQLTAKLEEGFLKSFLATASGRGSLKGPLARPRLEMEATLRDVDYLIFHVDLASGHLVFSDRTLTFEAHGEADLAQPLSTQGTIDWTRGTHVRSLDIVTHNHPLERILPSLKQKGSLEARFSLRGPPEKMTGEGEFTASRIDFGWLAADSLSSQVRLESDILKFSQIVADPPFLGRADGIGTLDVDFRNEKTVALVGRPVADLTLRAQYRKEASLFRIERLLIPNPYGTLSVTGDIHRSSGLNLKVDGELDLADLKQFRKVVREGEGTAKIRLHLKGPTDNPRVDGTLSLDGKMLILSNFDYALGPLQGTIQIDSLGYTLKDLKIGQGDGDILANGRIGSTGLKPNSLNLKLSASNLSWLSEGEFRLLFDGDFSVTGPFTNPSIVGSARITEGRYIRDFRVTEILLKPLQRETPLDKDDWSRFGASRLDIAVTQAGDVDVKNNIADIALKLDLHLKGTLAKPKLEGSLEAVEGKIYYLGNTLNLLAGRIDFTDPFKINPQIEIRAERLLAYSEGQGQAVDITFKGTLDNLRLEIPPGVNRRDYFTLVAFGHTEAELKKAGAGRGGYVAGGLALGEFSRLLEGPIGRYTGLDIVRVGAADVTRAQAVSEVTLGKHLSERLDLEFLSEIAPQDAQKTVSATYYLTDNIRLRGLRTGSPRTGGLYQVNLTLEFEYR